MGRLYREDHEGDRHLLLATASPEEALAVVARMDARGAELDALEIEEIEKIPREEYLGAYDSAVYVADDGVEYHVYDGQMEKFT